MGLIKAANIVDHVDPHHGDPEKFWNTSMWQSCCKWHHDSVKQRLEAMYAQGRVSLSDLWLNSNVAVAVANRMSCEAVHP